MAPKLSVPASLAPGSISLRLYPHDLDASGQLAELETQAVLAVTSGFDGVMISERHGVAIGNVPNPLQVAGWLLAAMPTGWAAACPLLLPFRPPAIVAEEVAWLAARRPGRVAVGFAAGGNRPDFELHGLDFDLRNQLFATRLEHVIQILSGTGDPGFAVDQAVPKATANGLVALSAAMSQTAARRAARLGLGIIDSSLPPVSQISAIDQAYRDAGGTGPHVLIRRVWLGDPPRAAIERQLAHYREMSGGERRQAPTHDDQTITANDPRQIADRLLQAVRASGADALNVRVHVRGLEPSAVREQIEAIGSDVLPLLREHWPARTER